MVVVSLAQGCASVVRLHVVVPTVQGAATAVSRRWVSIIAPSVDAIVISQGVGRRRGPPFVVAVSLIKPVVVTRGWRVAIVTARRWFVPVVAAR
jgi:hypothetical protein